MDTVYCYPDTNVLINKFNIRDNEVLRHVERDITSTNIAYILDNPVKGNYDLAHLQKIHRIIFQDIYPWAGEIRNGIIAKGNIFCLPQYILPLADSVFSKLTEENHLRNLPQDKFIDRLAFYMGEVNALHPFREGNGRTQRVFFSQLAKDAGYDIHFERMDKDKLLEADIAGMICDYSKLKALLTEHIEPMSRPRIKDRLTAAKAEADRINSELGTVKTIPDRDRGR